MTRRARLESLQTAQPISFFPEILRSKFSFLRGEFLFLRGEFSFLRGGVIFCVFNFTFFIVSYFSPFFLAFPCRLLCNIILCAAKMCICVADSYIFGILRVSTRILSELAQPRSRLRSTNFPVWPPGSCKQPLSLKACKLLKHALKTNSLQSRKSTSCVLFQPAYGNHF